jgi:hypothetical protein
MREVGGACAENLDSHETVTIHHTIYVIFPYMSGQNLPFALQHRNPHIGVIKHQPVIEENGHELDF